MTFKKASNPYVQATINPLRQDISIQFIEAMEVADPSQPVTIEVMTSGRKISYEVSNVDWSKGTAQVCILA